MRKPPKRIKYRGSEYVQIPGRRAPRPSRLKRKNAVSYWFGMEEMIEGYMGLQNIDELPDDAILAAEKELGAAVPQDVLDKALEHYTQDLYELAPSPDQFLSSVKRAVENALQGLLKDPDDEDVDAISRIGDDYAYEELFGFIGGSPEYNFQAELETTIEELTGKPADDVWNSLDKAASDAASEEWDGLQEDVVYAFDQSKAKLVENLVEDTEEYLEDQREASWKAPSKRRRPKTAKKSRARKAW